MKLKINKVKLFFEGKNNSDTKEISSMEEVNSADGKVFMVIESVEKLKKLLETIQQRKRPEKLHIYLELTFDTPVKIIKAAGGVVEKEDKILLIHRLGVWDLPKGKMEEGETKKESALREVEEECGIEVVLLKKIGSTIHHYEMGGTFCIKKTYWYAMKCTNDTNLKPQVEEGIEEVKWMTKQEAEKAIANSYSNIQEIVRSYYNL